MAKHCWHPIPESTVMQRSPQLVYRCCNCGERTKLDAIGVLPEPGKHGKHMHPNGFTPLPSDEDCTPT